MPLIMQRGQLQEFYQRSFGTLKLVSAFTLHQYTFEYHYRMQIIL